MNTYEAKDPCWCKEYSRFMEGDSWDGEMAGEHEVGITGCKYALDPLADDVAPEIPNTPPFTINEVIELHYDLGLETYYGFNMQQIMMKMDDKFMHDLRAFVDRCKKERE